MQPWYLKQMEKRESKRHFNLSIEMFPFIITVLTVYISVQTKASHKLFAQLQVQHSSSNHRLCFSYLLLWSYDEHLVGGTLLASNDNLGIARFFD